MKCARRKRYVQTLKAMKCARRKRYVQTLKAMKLHAAGPAGSVEYHEMSDISGEGNFDPNLGPQQRLRANTGPLPRPEDYAQSQHPLDNLPETEPGTTPLGGDLAKPAAASDSTAVLPKPKNSNRRSVWGPHRYAGLITQAILSSPEKRLTLAQVQRGQHQLGRCRFIKVQNEGTGKSSWWMISPDAKTGKCTRRRATLETSKYEKKRGRAKEKVEPIRGGLDHTPSPSSSLGDGLDGRFAESLLHPTQAGFLGGDYRHRANSAASSCGRLSPLAAWRYRHRLDSYQQEQLADSVDGGFKFEPGVPLAYRGINGYGLYAGGGPLSPNGQPAGLLPGPSGRPGPDGDHYNGLQSVSLAASVSSMSPSLTADHYAQAEGLYHGLPASSAYGASLSYSSPVSSSYTASPSIRFSSASPVSSGGSYTTSGFGNRAFAAPPPPAGQPRPSQLMSNLMGALQQNHMPVDLDLDTFQGGFDCDVDNIT
ncbi:forkhead box protein O-like [Pollicipes pollicipes]|uniref:forkhead box protein O-like n=1 Tax=Pollicipes pollicipes TaxID=41117 RepID=UPI001885A34A|nr:forkhead box protein O-like [Pollicipes pollicipes]